MATVERAMMLKTMRKHGVTLALFAAGSTGLTAAINELTKSTIDQQAALQQRRYSTRFYLPTAIITICLRVAIWSAPRRWAKASIKCGSPKITIDRSAR